MIGVASVASSTDDVRQTATLSRRPVARGTDNDARRIALASRAVSRDDRVAVEIGRAHLAIVAVRVADAIATDSRRRVAEIGYVDVDVAVAVARSTTDAVPRIAVEAVGARFTLEAGVRFRTRRAVNG